MSTGMYKHVEAFGENLLLLTGKVVTTTSGTVGSTDCNGFTVVKTASEVGRYTVTLSDTYRAIEFISASIEVAADAAVTDQKAFAVVTRNVGAAAAPKVADIQCLGADGDGDAADREVIDAAVLRILVVASRGGC